MNRGRVSASRKHLLKILAARGFIALPSVCNTLSCRVVSPARAKERLKVKLSDFIEAPRTTTAKYNERKVVFTYLPHVLTPLFFDTMETEADRRQASGKPGTPEYVRGELDGEYVSRKICEFTTSVRWSDEPKEDAVAATPEVMVAFPYALHMALIKKARAEMMGYKDPDTEDGEEADSVGE